MQCEKCGSKNIHVEYIQIYAKEKVDLPKKPKLEKPQKSEINYPTMPDDKILRALQHSYDELGDENYRNKSIAMPVIARHIATEAQEHYYSVPKSFYNWYINTPIDQVRPKPQTEEKPIDKV